ncbi:hypothetical protein ACW0JT_23205 [Arthrobacter sp. SA17]
MTKRRRLLDIAVPAFLVAAALTGCAAQAQMPGENLQAFSSIDEAYAAIDDILDCEPDPVGQPIVPMGDGVPLTSAQKLCFENVQIDLYTDQTVLQESYRMMSDSNQGKVHLVQGKNWMVVDLSEMATGQPSTRNIERLAKELNGEYAVVGA